MSITFVEGEVKSVNVGLTAIAPITATLRVVVSDAETHYAIEGARAELIGVGYTTTDKYGWFDITDIPPGTYTCKVTHPDYDDYTETMSFAEGEVKDVSIRLTPIAPAPASLHGYVTDAETGGAVAGARVELIGLTYATTNSTGYFEITDIPPGTYSGKVTHPDYYDYTF